MHQGAATCRRAGPAVVLVAPPCRFIKAYALLFTDGNRLTPSSRLVFKNVLLEKRSARRSGDVET